MVVVRSLFLCFLMLLAACAVPRAVALAAPSTDDSLERIRQRGVVRIGLLRGAPPMCVAGPKGEPVGFDADLARRLGAEIMNGRGRVELVLLDAAERIPALVQGKVDILTAALSVTPQREADAAFARPYLRTHLGVLSPSGAAVTSPEQLAGRRVAVVRSSVAEAYVKARHPGARLMPFASLDEAVAALERKEADAVIEDGLLLAKRAANTPGLAMGLADLGEEALIAPAVNKKDRELLRRVNAVLGNLTAQDWFDAAFDRHMAGYAGLGLDREKVLHRVVCEHGQCAY